MRPCHSEAFDEILTRVRSLAPLVAEHRATFDRARRLPETVFKACADAGLFRLWLPQAFNAPELSPLQFMEVVEAVSELDGSVGWLVGNGAGLSRVAGYLPETAVRSWFDDPHAFIASATGAIGSAVPTRDGYRLSGRWPFGSGAQHATHFMGLCGVAEADAGNGGKLICCYVPRAQVTVIDNWHVSGLRGTGSCDFEICDVAVPTEHTHPLMDHRATRPELLYRMPIISVFAWTVAVVPLGIARAAMDTVARLATTKVRVGTSAPLREREIIQCELGRADAQLRAGRAFLREAMHELMAATECGGERLIRARATLKTACTFAAESAVRILAGLSSASGTAAIFETSPLERCIRDVHAAVKHAAMSPNNYVVGGRLALGLNAGVSRF
jgi:indole-3-acetate monooxygenase